MPIREVQIPSRVEKFFQEERHGRRRMLALTYEFDPAAFERAFAAVLRRPILVDVVAGRECEGSTTRARFWRARWSGTFHPKMIVLLANSRVCVGLGSANLTSSGLGENLETWCYFEGNENRAVLSGVRDFLKTLDTRRAFPSKVEIEEFIGALPKSKQPHAVFSTLHGPLLSQVVSRVRKPVRQVDIITPINCDPTSVVRQLRRTIGGKEYRLYTDKEPVPRIYGITKSHTLKRPERDEEGDGLRAISLAHAKVYAFDNGKTVDMFWGSANLSYSAWLAKGNRANVELLVHSRTSSKEWFSFRDKSLPRGHRWVVVDATGKPPQFPEERQTIGWQLLHAQLERGEVWLEANKPGNVHLLLKAENCGQSFKCMLKFTAIGACLPKRVRDSLGFSRDQAPRFLQWSLGSRRRWFKIPVNRLDLIGEDGGSTDLAQQLFWEFTGRTLPRSDHRTNAKFPEENSPDRPDLSEEEEELTRSEHQGDLDRFVLEWRTIARRVAQSSRGNDDLRLHHIASVKKRIDIEARISPKKWPDFKRSFVHRLLEREWPV